MHKQVKHSQTYPKVENSIPRISWVHLDTLVDTEVPAWGMWSAKQPAVILPGLPQSQRPGPAGGLEGLVTVHRPSTQSCFHLSPHWLHP